VRIHASGTGKTIEEALAKPLVELATASLHAHEVERLPEGGKKIVDGKMVFDPEKGRCANPHRALLEGALRDLAALVKPVEGYRFRVYASHSNDGPDAHIRVEVDLVKE